MVDKSQQRVRSMFAEIAGRYDLMNHVLSANVDRYWRWWMVRHLAPVPGGPVLDVCTGTGDLAIAYWRAAAGRSDVIGTDFCRPMLEKAAEKKRRHGADGSLRFLEADALELPFADGQFPLVVIAFGLRNLADTRRGLRELHRVCRPGGRLGVLEFSMPSYRPLRAAYALYFRHVLPRVGQWLTANDQAAYEYLPESVEEFPSGKDLAAWFTECGWRDVCWKPLSGGIATLYMAKR